MDEVADFMGISYITLYRMVRDGRIEVLNTAKSGKKPIYGFTAEAVQAYYDSIGGKENIRKRGAKKDTKEA